MSIHIPPVVTFRQAFVRGAGYAAGAAVAVVAIVAVIVRPPRF